MEQVSTLFYSVGDCADDIIKTLEKNKESSSYEEVNAAYNIINIIVERARFRRHKQHPEAVRMSHESEAHVDKIIPWFVVKNLMMLVISNTTNQGSKMVAVKVKKGHLSAVCRISRVKSKINAVEEEEIIFLGEISSDVNYWTAQLGVDNHNTRFKLGTGAAVTVLSDQTPWLKNMN
ncbi:Hypothetical predicted protein [Paramuricea clavata]|uniref:Uncharacterized protein n=1 Tax=Paramuricea clavata TaxID=317549 RepID=A0A7D9HNC8_PARCT|nr:Hypothetical predicted protein [Paramuricea clavata]